MIDDEGTTDQDMGLQSYRETVRRLSHRLTQRVGEAFWMNVRSAQLHSQVPLFVVTQLELSAMTDSELGEEWLSESDMSKLASGELTTDEDNLIAKRLERRWGAVEKTWTGMKDRSFLAELSRRVDVRLRAIRDMDDLPEALESIGGSCVIQLWSAFEFMTAELWSSAIDSRPSSLGVIAAEWAIQKPDLANWARTQLRKPVSGVPVRTGKFLRSYLNFTSAKQIRSYYESVFDGLSFGDKWVPTANKIQAARNILLHNGGIVNSQFRRLAPDIPSTHGTRLRFSEAKVHGFSRLTLELGLSLLTAVDSWLASHPDKIPSSGVRVH